MLELEPPGTANASGSAAARTNRRAKSVILKDRKCPMGGGGEGRGREEETSRLTTTRTASVVLYSESINMCLRRHDQKLHRSHRYAAPELISSVLFPAINIRQEHLSLATMAASRKSTSRPGLIPATQCLSQFPPCCAFQKSRSKSVAWRKTHPMAERSCEEAYSIWLVCSYLAAAADKGKRTFLAR